VNSQNLESNPLASDLKYHLRRVLQTDTTSFSITVYHEDSPMRAEHRSCYLGNPCVAHLHALRSSNVSRARHRLRTKLPWLLLLRRLRNKLPCILPLRSTCCEFTIRIVDAEDPALLYPPCGPGQSITLCMDVLTCGKCQWEVAKPSSSSDRVCTGRGDKRPGARWVHWNPLGLFSMPFPSFTEAHTEYSERLSKDSTHPLEHPG
jgi:hypothetical protein